MEHANQIQRGQRTAAHRVHIRKRIGRGDLPVGKRVVHDGREKVRRLHQRPVAIDSIHPCVVSCGRANQQIRTFLHR